MRRYSSPYASSFSFGPGPLSTALKALIGANVAVFLAVWALPVLGPIVALIPYRVVHELFVWQPATYMFAHAGISHLVINMLTLWMFGTELERLWGTRFFLKFYFACGIGAGLITIAFALLPFAYAQQIYVVPTVGASGAVFGLLLAYGLYYPDRPLYLYFVFPVPAKDFGVMIGALSFFAGGGVAHATHLGGLVVGYLYLKGTRLHPISELKYRYLKWKINRVRKKFDVYSGGRANQNDRVH